MVITYQYSSDGIRTDQLTGFFVGWPSPPSSEAHLRILTHSAAAVLAVDQTSERGVGFITAITDYVVTTYIPHLEVLLAYQGQGIGRSLVKRMIARLQSLYAIDLVCDADVGPFYENLGFRKVGGMCLRHYDHQAGAPELVLEMSSGT